MPSARGVPGFGKSLGPFTRPARCLAFTLVELLVVLTIIAGLASLLLPLFGRAKESSRTAVCSSNVRQLGIAAAAYSLDNRGGLPDFLTWLHAIGNDVTTGKLYPYLRSQPVYLCPTDRLAAAGKTNTHRAFSYAMNCLLCHQTDISKFVSPSQTFVFMEPNLGANDLSGLVGPVMWMGTTNAISARHNGAAHLVFSDFHVERVKIDVARKLERSRRFWLPNNPTDQLTLGFVSGLTDP